MPNHTVVAVYETAAQAAAAVNDLQAAHVLPDAISQHTKTLNASGTAHSAPREQGFWASLFGSEHDTSVYDRTVEEGASVLTVRVPDDGVDRVTSILESHNPIDLDERAARRVIHPAGVLGNKLAASCSPSGELSNCLLSRIEISRESWPHPTLFTRRYPLRHEHAALRGAVRANDSETQTPWSLDPMGRKDDLAHAHGSDAERRY